MPRVRDVLHRFRPSGTPGAATAAGVPVDRAVELAAELAPVFALLEETERECAQVLDRAGHDAAGARARDAERVAAVVASGRARVEAERASAAALARGALLADGNVGPGGSGRPVGGGPGTRPGGTGGTDDPLAPFVDQVVDSVRALLGLGGNGGGPSAGAR
jgi:hypothetical protein